MLYLPCTIKKKKRKKEISTQKPNPQKHCQNIEMNPNTQKKINSKHNKRIRQKENLRYKQISTYVELKFY